ncbi:MAG: hypothetical protein OXE77_05270 [Flavobacteriaceae bacterium]|nr:hypothetical protein [Flavobacteriaceae bacterium]MCY4267438.1 hypothetical protein [Flavobacteriaceae bacterium]MCY4299122.1 hypothetical protein [Flavobacteriaceae bacterium]
MKKLLFLLVVVFFSTAIYSFEYTKMIHNSETGKTILIEKCRIYGTTYVEIGGETILVNYDVTDNSCSEAWAFLDEMISDIMAQFDEPGIAPNPGG